MHSGAADYLENNMAYVIEEPPKFLITYLVDHFKKSLQQWFYNRKRVAELMSTPLITWADRIASDRKDQIEKLIGQHFYIVVMLRRKQLNNL